MKLPRRGGPVVLVLIALTVAAGIAWVRRSDPAAPPALRDGPNVIVLVMDTTRGDRCSINGYERPTTPCLEALARDSVVFRDAWSPANWTGPAHASLFTGQRAEHHGFYEGNRRFLAEGADTLARRLAAAGYATACFTNNAAVSPAFGLTQGFAKVEDLSARKGRSYPWARSTHEEAADWARACARAGRPFFLFVNDMEPHLPYAPPPEFAKRFVRSLPTREEADAAESFGYPHTIAYDLGTEEIGAPKLALLSDLYDGEVAALDAEIGRLVERLRADGLLDSTLLVILGDHGENLGDHHLFEHALGLHRTLCHVPLLVRLPGEFDGGRVVNDVVRVEDVFPTVLECCGLGVPKGIDGVSLTHDVPGRVARALQTPQVRELRAYESECGPADMRSLLRGIRSVYDGRHHLLAYSDGTEELFDVSADPSETSDLRTSRPEIAARLRGILPPEPPVDIAAAPK